MVAASACVGCYSGDFLDLACDRQGTCPGATDDSGGSTTEDGPTLDAYRVDSIALADPHFYYTVLGNCVDVSDVFDAALNDQIAAGNLNLALVFDRADPTADEVGVTFTEAKCVIGSGKTTCGFQDAQTFIPVNAVNQREAACDIVEPGTLNPLYASAGPPNVPAPVCFSTPRAPIVLPSFGSLPPIVYQVAQLAASYGSDRAPVDGIVQGVLAGYMPAAQAMTLSVDVSGTPFQLWTVIAGSGVSCQPDPMNPIDDTDADPNPEVIERGVWFYFNFTASRVEWVE